jgi:hypothetical protein
MSPPLPHKLFILSTCFSLFVSDYPTMMIPSNLSAVTTQAPISATCASHSPSTTDGNPPAPSDLVSRTPNFPSFHRDGFGYGHLIPDQRWQPDSLPIPGNALNTTKLEVMTVFMLDDNDPRPRSKARYESMMLILPTDVYPPHLDVRKDVEQKIIDAARDHSNTILIRSRSRATKMNSFGEYEFFLGCHMGRRLYQRYQRYQ